ncbi:peptidoglycan DD-metalloendopeptidase family protein [uncultured Metabacillus sp.]|uniref:M23 family metallopeptidase n=1 Tax=Metabacillus sp. Hm71 TaxID=3450743 RepID=UPI0026042BE9|nr:peptidoglycan DD-metalloendopeptidase family protein [uncultured Metabacillus sp.]
MLVNVKKVRLINMFGLFIGITLCIHNQVEAQSYIDELEENWVQPVDGVITDTFGTRNGNHKGIDIAAPEGEKIVSVSAGNVTKSYHSDTYGHVVFVEHPEGYETVYAHLSKRLVSEGDILQKGQTLGIIGNTGVSTGTHLHFELHKGEWTYEKEHALDPIFVFDLPNETVHSEDKQSSKTSKQNTESNVFKEKSAETELQSTTIVKPQGKHGKEQELPKKVITIMKGDTLWKVSQIYKVTIPSLQKWNKLETDLIYPGQKLIVYVNNETNYATQSGNASGQR